MTSRPLRSTRFLGMKITPLTQRRLHNFRANRRGYWSLWIFLGLFVFSLFAEFVANDRPFFVYYDGGIYMPVFQDYPETTFGGSFETATEYKDPFVQELINEKGWMAWPIIRYNHRTVSWDLPEPAPSAPSAEHWLGTDDQARDVLARLIYGFRISVLFGLVLTIFSAIIGFRRARCRATSAAGRICCFSASWRSGPACPPSIC